MDLESLFETHWNQILEIRAEHLDLMLSTKEADAEQLERAIESIYRLSDKSPPEQIIWFDSHIDALLGLAMWSWIVDPFVHGHAPEPESESALVRSMSDFWESANNELRAEFPTLFSMTEEPELILAPHFHEILDADLDRRGSDGDLITAFSTDVQVSVDEPFRVKVIDLESKMSQLYAFLEDPVATKDSIVKEGLEKDLKGTATFVKHDLFGPAFSMNLRSNLNSAFRTEVSQLIEDGVVDRLLAVYDKVSKVLRVNLSEWEKLRPKLLNIADDAEFRNCLGMKARGFTSLRASHSAMADSFPAAIHRAFAELGRGTTQGGQPLLDSVKAGGWWWPFEDICFACDNPSELHFDSKFSLHNENGPAVRFRDGFEIWALNNVIVSEKIVRNNFTAADIDALDALFCDTREIMIRRYGLSKYLQESNAEIFHEDDYGKLYRKTLSNGKSVGIIVTDPISDFEFNQFSIAIPPEITTATDAVEWVTMQSKFLAGIA